MILSRKKSTETVVTENFDEIFANEFALPVLEGTATEGFEHEIMLEENWGEVRAALYLNEFAEADAQRQGASQEELDILAEASAKEMFDNVVNWFKKLGATIKSYVEAFMARMKNFFTKDGKKLVANNPVKDIVAKDLSDLKVKCFDFFSVNGSNLDKYINSIEGAVKSAGLDVESLDSSIKSMSADKLKDAREKAKGLAEELYKAATGESAKADAKKKLNADLRGSEEKIEISIDKAKIEQIATFLNGSAGYLTSISKYKDRVLKGINQTIKTLEGVKKRFGKDASAGASMSDGSRNGRTQISGAAEGQESNAVQYISTVISAQKTSKSVQQQVLNAGVSAMSDKTKTFMAIYRKAASFNPKKSKDENVNESFLVESVGVMEDMFGGIELV